MKPCNILLFLTGFFFISFLTPDANLTSHTTSLPFHVDVEKGIKNVSFVPLSRLGSKIEYVPLETKPECLLKSLKNVNISESFIYATDGSRLLQFSRAGRFIRQIGTPGRGPGEYLNVFDFIIDNSNQEIYVLSSPQVLVYSLEGKFKRDFKIDFQSFQFIATEGGKFIFHPVNMASPVSDTVYSWYIFNKNGVIQRKLINTLKRVNRYFVTNSPLYLFEGKAHFMEYGVDTLYRFDNQIKVPYAIFNLGKLKMKTDPTLQEAMQLKGKIFIWDIKESKTSLFIETSGDSTSYVHYDKKSLAVTTLKEKGFINDLDGGLAFYPKKILNDNTLVDYKDAFTLIKHLSNNKESIAKIKDRKRVERFTSLVKSIDVSSNPVIIILSQ
jgi:hypothetical protein